MTNQIMPFEFEGKKLRVEGDFENPLFNANDVCAILKHSNPWIAVKRWVDRDDLTKCYAVDESGRNQEFTYVNESGLYALIFGSKSQAAKIFKKHVTSVILPSIRKTGSYGSDERINELEKKVDRLERESATWATHLFRLEKDNLMRKRSLNMNKVNWENTLRMLRLGWAYEQISECLNVKVSTIKEVQYISESLSEKTTIKHYGNKNKEAEAGLPDTQTYSLLKMVGGF